MNLSVPSLPRILASKGTNGSSAFWLRSISLFHASVAACLYAGSGYAVDHQSERVGMSSRV